MALALGLAFGLSVGAVPAASAATITVNNLSGTSVVGQCTLRDAIQAANTDAVVQGCAAGSGADTINFTVTGTISLASEIDISADVTISGPGAGNLTLAPSGTNRVFYIDDNSPAVTISGVTFLGNGTANGAGAAIYHYGGPLTIQNSVFTGNVTIGRGGAIFNYSGAVTIQSSTFSGNHALRGGAIYLYGGSLNIQTSTFTGNVATSNGGAINLYNAGALTISDSTLSGNQGSRGGAIYLYHSAAATITNSTISGNSSTSDGGAIAMGVQTLTVRNSTITGNTAGGGGGAFYLSDSGGSVLNLTSTIVANSTDSGGTRDIVDQGNTINGSNSLVENPNGFSFTINVANITGQDPLLGPLANNGGPTQTHALLSGSPAIDAGSNPALLAFDQRGTGFARSSGGSTDMGAFEVQGGPPPPPPVTVVGIPTLSQWGIGLLSVLMAGWAMLTGFGRRRRR